MFIKITTCLFKYIHGQDTITDPSLYIIGVGKKKTIYVPLHSPRICDSSVPGQVCFVKSQVTVGH